MVTDQQMLRRKNSCRQSGLGYSAWDILGVPLAVEEAIHNGLRHGNRGDPAKRLRLRWSVGSEVMFAEVEDEGLGFDPALVPDPSRYETRAHPRPRAAVDASGHSRAREARGERRGVSASSDGPEKT
jgi:anti-sigma regulatory factor (Ser/Thr protein kinase)